MQEAKRQISISQYVLIIYKSQIGFGILTLPRYLTNTAGADGWISICIGWVLSTAISLMIVQVMSRNPNDSFFDVLTKYFGKRIGKGIHLLWLLYALLAATVAIFSIIHLMQVWISPNVNPFLLMFLFLVPVYMMSRQDLRAIGNFAEVVFLTTIWMPPILFFSLQEVEWLNLLPLVREGWFPILSGVPFTLLPFLGLEMIYVLYPRLCNKKAAYKATLLANLLTFVVTLLPVLICFVKFSQEEIVTSVWPTLNLLKLIQFPFLERLEIIFLSAYLFVLIATIVNYLYFFLAGAEKLLKKSKSIRRNLLPMILMSWLALLFWLTPTFVEINLLKSGYYKIDIVLVYLFTVGLWIYSGFFHRMQRGRKVSL